MKVWKTAVCVIALLLLLAGCDPYAGEYPFLEEAEWICDDPYFVIQYTQGTSGRMEDHITYEWNGEVFETGLYFQSSMFSAMPKWTTAHEDRYFEGTWEYRDGNLVLIIEDDQIFGGKYQELVFYKTTDSRADPCLKVIRNIVERTLV